MAMLANGNMLILLSWLTHNLLILLSVAFFTLFERNVIGLFHLRIGPNKVSFIGLVQPLLDAFKLLSKQDIYPIRANKFTYSLSPLVSLFLSLFVWMTLPMIFNSVSINFSLVFFFLLSSFMVFPVLMSGWSSNSKYSLVGSLRSISQSVSYESVFSTLLVLFSVALLSYSAQACFSISSAVYFSVMPLWVVCTLAETHRAPFDFSEAESELVSGFNTEYSGAFFAFIFLSEYGVLIFSCGLMVYLFLNWSVPITLSLFLSLTLILCFVFIWVRITFCRFRYDFLMILAWKVLLPMSLCFFIIFSCVLIYVHTNNFPIILTGVQVCEGYHTLLSMGALHTRNSHPLIKIINSTLVDLPTPANLSLNWNWGSLLGLILVIQLITGLILTTRYSAHVDTAFDSVIYICQDVNYGWLLRLVHSTGASFFFLFLYFHIGRGLYYGSFVFQETWNIGVVIYLVLIGTAFLGYVLPWGQISYWAATVITNLLSAVPYMGNSLVEWVWGGFAVSNATLVRFYTLHFLLPFLVSVLVILHIFYLHTHGSSNPLGVSSLSHNVPFHYYFSSNDLYIYFLFLFVFVYTTLVHGYDLMDAVNWIPANPLVTPTHIQPEWYFLFAYAILRSIPNKLGGVVALLLAVLSLFFFSSFSNSLVFSGFSCSPLGRSTFWCLITSFLILTWLGSCPASSPFNEVALAMTILYFFLIVVLSLWSHISSRNYLQ